MIRALLSMDESSIIDSLELPQTIRKIRALGMALQFLCSPHFPLGQNPNKH